SHTIPRIAFGRHGEQRRSTGQRIAVTNDRVDDSATPGTALRETPLRGRHEELGARLIPFAGWLMPVQYTGIVDEHRTVRSAAGLFDLGHMGQVRVTGSDALPYLQQVSTNDVSVLAPGDAQYSLLPNEQGGVIDDIIIYRLPDDPGYLVVVNAANHAKDVAWLQQQRAARPEFEAEVEDVSDSLGMIAIQGPTAAAIVAELSETDLSGLGPFQILRTTVAGLPVLVARTGYTGEDGFEFYVPQEHTLALWDSLLAAGTSRGLKPIGLGARDTLRLEARMPLYGNELADDISPLEAGLGWAVKLDKGPFIGREAIAAVKESGPPRRTVGFQLRERAGSARHGYPVTLEDRDVGVVTSGAHSPTLGSEIGLALVDAEVAGVGRPLEVVIRGRPVKAEQVKLPFYRRSRD
ncbi:MAG TPA: glycine cleavage system aminomethyltransferase GcvT, partial [Thermomicrobiales bacterium]|nr:glycine cleavage system aminomethyltransferase GcvT [Thermomicrobiales bacterium]